MGETGGGEIYENENKAKSHTCVARPIVSGVFVGYMGCKCTKLEFACPVFGLKGADICGGYIVYRVSKETERLIDMPVGG